MLSRALGSTTNKLYFVRVSQRKHYVWNKFKSTKTRNQTILDRIRKDLPPEPQFQDGIQNVYDHEKLNYHKLEPITPNDSYVSCTSFDDKGNISAISKKFPKMSFLKQNGLFPRDLRKIDTSSVDVVPLITVRPPRAILINLLHIKAIIEKDAVMIFDTSNPAVASKLGVFMYDLEMKLKLQNGNICYEFRALESILISVMSSLEAELKVHTANCGLILAELEDQVDRHKLQDLLIKSKKLSSFYQKTVLIQNVLEELLDNDEDLAGMYLSAPKKPGDGDCEDLEMILESYFKQCEEFVQQAGSLLSDIKATEEIVNIILDTNRNSLMLYELKITVYTLGFTVATLFPAFYGMNLKNYIEDSAYGFGLVVLVSILQGVIITMINIKKLRNVQKLTMMGDTPKHKPHYTFGSMGFLNIERWFRRLIYGNRATKFDHPTSKEADALWRMINDDRSLK
ncbi:uncharacterized protein PRCAT00003616001 [Priceomyces carsonii]|uniref:uncharacterized protein n=1 Tax=Priceomyces carsonii TaxID=28549 RepID=UPI002ED9BFF5|nr:unnamed protein product [Priceomyces carsonii]